MVDILSILAGPGPILDFNSIGDTNCGHRTCIQSNIEKSILATGSLKKSLDDESWMTHGQSGSRGWSGSLDLSGWDINEKKY